MNQSTNPPQYAQHFSWPLRDKIDMVRPIKTTIYNDS